MFGHPARQKIYTLFTLVCLGSSGLAPCWAASDFAADWQAKPLIDHNTPAAAPTGTVSSVAKTASPNHAAQAEAEKAAIEAKLKPAEPFISSVEKQLLITAQPGAPLIQRLNTLQSVLYGEARFQDAGELLGDLARLFPTEAAKAEADLQTKLQATKPALPRSITGSQTKRLPAPGNPALSPSILNETNASTNTPTPRKRFWQSNDDPFANDPFFQDQPTPKGGQPSGSSKLGAIGQGLTGLAMMAGAVAGSYYLNRGNTALAPQNGFYNHYPYGANPYRLPYGYGPNGYGQIPYTGYPYAYPGGMTMTSQPYSPYGRATIRPFGPYYSQTVPY